MTTRIWKKKSADGRDSVLVMTEVFTKYAWAVPTRDQKASMTAKVLVREWFQHKIIGVPHRLLSDRSRNFESSTVRELCKLYDVPKSPTIAYHPEGNGQCEWFNRSLHDLLRTLPSEQKRKWTAYLPELCTAYNASPHASTGYSPFYLMFGRDPRLPVDALLGGSSETDGDGSVDDWLAVHQDRLREQGPILMSMHLTGSCVRKESALCAFDWVNGFTFAAHHLGATKFRMLGVQMCTKSLAYRIRMAIRIPLNELMDLDNRTRFVDRICNLLFFLKLFPPPHQRPLVWCQNLREALLRKVLMARKTICLYALYLFFFIPGLSRHLGSPV